MSVLPYQEVTRRIEELTRAIYSLDPYFVMSPTPGESADESVATLSMLVSTADRARANRRPRSPERRERRRPEREARDQISLSVADAPVRAKSPGWVLEGTTYAEIVKGQNSRSSSIAGTRQLSAQRYPSARREPSPRRVLQYEAYEQARVSPEKDRPSEVISVPVQSCVPIEPMYEPVYDPSDRYCENVVYENVSESVPYRDDANVYVYQEQVSEINPVSQEIHQYYENQPVYYQLESRDSYIEAPKVIEEPKAQYMSELEPPRKEERAQSPAANWRSQDLSYAEILALGLRRQPKTQSVTTLPKPQVAQVEIIKEIVVEHNFEISPPIQQFESKVERTDFSKLRSEEPERPCPRSQSRDMPRQRRPEKRLTKAHDVQIQKKKKLPKKVVEVQDFDDVIETEQILPPAPVQSFTEHREEHTAVSNISPTKEITKKIQHSSTVVETVTETLTADDPHPETNVDSTENKKSKKKHKHKKIKTGDEIEKALKEIQDSEKHKKKKIKESRDKSTDHTMEQTHDEIVEPVTLPEIQSKELEPITKTKKKKGPKEQLKEITPTTEVATPDISINEPVSVESQEDITKATKQKKRKIQKEIKESIAPIIEDINTTFIREESNTVPKPETYDIVSNVDAAVTEILEDTQVENISVALQEETGFKILTTVIDSQSVDTEVLDATEPKEIQTINAAEHAEIKKGDSSKSKKKKGLKDKQTHNKAAEVVQESIPVESITHPQRKSEQVIPEQSPILSEEADVNSAAKSNKKKKNKKHEKAPELRSVEIGNDSLEVCSGYNIVTEIMDVKEIEYQQGIPETYVKSKDFVDHTQEKTVDPETIKDHHEVVKGSKKKSKSKKTKEFEPKYHEIDVTESEIPVHTEGENIDNEEIVTTEEAQFEVVKTHKKKSKSKKAKVVDDDIEKALREIEQSESTKRKPKDKTSKNKEKRGAVYVEENKTLNIKSGNQSLENEKFEANKENIITMDWNTLMAEEERVTEPLIEPIEQPPPDVIETSQQIATEVTIVQETDNLLRQEIENIVKEAEIIKADLEITKAVETTEEHKSKEASSTEIPTTSSPGEQNNNDKFFSTDTVKEGSINIVEDVTRYEPIEKDIETHTIYLITHEKKKLPPIRTVKVFSSKSNSLEESSPILETTSCVEDQIKNNKIADEKSSNTFDEAETPEVSKVTETVCTEKSSEMIKSTIDVSEKVEIQQAIENAETLKLQEPSIVTEAEETESVQTADILQETTIQSETVTENVVECDFDNIFEQAIFGSVQDRNKITTTKEKQTSPEIPYQELVEEVKTYSLNLDFEQLSYDYSQFLANERQSSVIENINTVDSATQPNIDKNAEIPVEEVPKHSYQTISDAENDFAKDKSIGRPVVFGETQQDAAYIIEKAPRFSYYEIQDAECNLALNNTRAAEEIIREEQPTLLPQQTLAEDIQLPTNITETTVGSAEIDFISNEKICSSTSSEICGTVEEQSEPCDTHVISKSQEFGPLQDPAPRQSYHEIVDAEILLASIKTTPRSISENIQLEVEMKEPEIEPAEENSTSPVFEPPTQSYHEICDAERLLGEIKSREPSPSPEIELITTTVTSTMTNQVFREQNVNQVTPVTNGVVAGPLIADDVQDEEERHSVYEVPRFSYHEISDAENLFAQSLRPLQSVIQQDEMREINTDSQDPTTSLIVISEEVTINDSEIPTTNMETISTEVDEVSVESNQTKEQSPSNVLITESSTRCYSELHDAELLFANIATRTSEERKQDEIVKSTEISIEEKQSLKSTPEIAEKDQSYKSASEPTQAFEIDDLCDTPVPIVYGTDEELYKSELQIETRKVDDTVESTELPSVEKISEVIEDRKAIFSQVPDALKIFTYEIDDLDDTLVPVVFGDIKKVEFAIKERQTAQLRSEEASSKETIDKDAILISEEVVAKPVETKPDTISAAFIQSEISHTFSSLLEEPVIEIKNMCPASIDRPEQPRDVINTDQSVVAEVSKDSVDSVMSEQFKSDTSVKSEKSPIHSLHDLLPEIDSIPEFKPSFSNTVLYSNLSADAPEFTPSYMYQNIENTVPENKPTSMTIGNTQSSVEVHEQSQIAPEIIDLDHSTVSLPQTCTHKSYSTIVQTHRDTEEPEPTAEEIEPEALQQDTITQGFVQEEHVDTKTKRSKKKKKKEDRKEVSLLQSQPIAAPSLQSSFEGPEPVNVWAKAAEEGKSYAEVVAEGLENLEKDCEIPPSEKQLHAEAIKEGVKDIVVEPTEAESVHSSWAKIVSVNRPSPDRIQLAEIPGEPVQTTHRPPMILVDESNTEHHKPEVEVDGEGFITVERHRRSRSRSRDNKSCPKSKASENPDTRDKSENRFNALTSTLKSEDTVHSSPQDEEKLTVQKGRKSRSSKSTEKEIEPKIIFPSTSIEGKLVPKKDKKKRSSKSKEKIVQQEKEIITTDKKEITPEKETLQPKEEISIVTQSEPQESKKKSKKKKKDKKTEIDPIETTDTAASSAKIISSEQETNIEKQTSTRGYQRLIETQISTPESVHTPIKERVFSEAQYWKVDPSGLEDLSHLDENITIAIEKPTEELKPAENISTTNIEPQQVISNLELQLQPDVSPESDEKKILSEFITHEILTSITEKQEQLAEKISEEQSLESKMADLQREIEEMLLPENDSLLGDDTPKELTDIQSSADYQHEEMLDNITPALASPEPCDEVIVAQKIDIHQYQLDDKHISMSMIDSLLNESELMPAAVHHDKSSEEPEQAIQTKEHESKLTPGTVLPEESLVEIPFQVYKQEDIAEKIDLVKEAEAVDIPKPELHDESRTGSAEEHITPKQSDIDTVSSQLTQVITVTKTLEEPIELSEPLLTNNDPTVTINNLLNLKEDHFWTDKFITDDAERLLLEQNVNFPKPNEIISEFKIDPKFESEIKIDLISKHLSDDDISVEENISNDSSFWPDKHLYHDAEREYFLLMARESKSPSPPKVEIEIKDQNDKDKGPGGGSGHSSETEEPRDSCGSPFDSNYISMDLPGGICSWKDQSSYLSLETPTDSLGPISENTPFVETDSREDILTTSPHEPVAPPPPSQEQPGGEDASQRRAKVTDPQSYCTILQFILYVWHDILTKFLISLIVRICIVRCRVAMPNLPFVL